jgi:hypothetical protein
MLVYAFAVSILDSQSSTAYIFLLIPVFALSASIIALFCSIHVALIYVFAIKNEIRSRIFYSLVMSVVSLIIVALTLKYPTYGLLEDSTLISLLPVFLYVFAVGSWIGFKFSLSANSYIDAKNSSNEPQVGQRIYKND